MPKIVDHDKCRQEMLGKCFYFFGRKGYSNITLVDIANEIGVSKGKLYHYFPSKENVLNELIAWAAIENVNEYERRAGSVNSFQDRVDQIVFVLKESGEFYRNILLLAADLFRVMNIEQVTKLYAFFSEYYISMISEMLNISREFAQSIFLHIIGIIFNSLALNNINEYNKQVDTLSTILRPIIVNAPYSKKKAAQKFNEIINSQKLVLPKTVAMKNKITKIKKDIIEQKGSYLKKQLNNSR